MTSRIVVIGAGHAGVQLVDSLREEGYDGEIVLLGDERTRPYQRPPLTKEYLLDPASAVPLPLRSENFFAAQNVDLHLGVRAERIDRQRRLVMLGGGDQLAYDQLVLATGARARSHPRFNSAAVHTIRDVEDATRFTKTLSSGASLAVIGAGFIGLEVAAAARAHGVDVTIVTSRPPLSRMASAGLSRFLLEKHTANGCDFVFESVSSVERSIDRQGETLICASGRRITADVTLVAIGALPNAELATAAGLDTNDGVLVDAFLRTSDERVWAIGDVARPCTGVGVPIRQESVQAATHQARCLAATLLGRPTTPSEVPWFWSNQGTIRIQIAGQPDPKAESVVRGDPSTERFSVFRFSDGRLQCVESVNHGADHVSARRLLASGVSLSQEQAADLDFDLKSHSRLTSGVGA